MRSKPLFFVQELAKPILKSRTDTSIKVKFVPIREGTNPLSYFVDVTGTGAPTASVSCDPNIDECTVPNLSPGQEYGITVKSCITQIPSTVCSDGSDAATIKTLPKGK